MLTSSPSPPAGATVPTLLWDFTGLIVGGYVGTDPAGVDWRTVLEYFEAQLAAGDRYVSELIGTSFLESLPGPGMPGHGIVRELGAMSTPMFSSLRPAG